MRGVEVFDDRGDRAVRAHDVRVHAGHHHAGEARIAAREERGPLGRRNHMAFGGDHHEYGDAGRRQHPEEVGVVELPLEEARLGPFAALDPGRPPLQGLVEHDDAADPGGAHRHGVDQTDQRAVRVADDMGGRAEAVGEAVHVGGVVERRVPPRGRRTRRMVAQRGQQGELALGTQRVAEEAQLRPVVLQSVQQEEGSAGPAHTGASRDEVVVEQGDVLDVAQVGPGRSRCRFSHCSHSTSSPERRGRSSR